MAKPFSISQLAIPAVWALIIFLTFTSQYFFLHFEAAPLRENELWAINILAACIGLCYYRSCTVDPGRITKDWKALDQGQLEGVSGRQRWCRRCEAFKPPRAHHCRTCGRCIPKMDHHCPWTSNCVSHFTFPHFIRFLFYTVVGMSYLESLLFERASIIWASRDLPSVGSKGPSMFAIRFADVSEQYLGPSIVQMIHLFILLVVNGLAVFAIFILLVRSLWSLGANTTTIESWEIERHSTLLRRARHFGGYLEAPGGARIRIRKQEFPYDIGIWANIKAGMGGSANVLSWLWPFAATPDGGTGYEFEINEFEDPNVSWPPPDPDRISLPVSTNKGDAFTTPHVYSSAHEEIQAFNGRQAQDMKRVKPGQEVQRRKRFYNRIDTDAQDESDSSGNTDQEGSDGEEAWRNSEGERLHDFGVDEEIEFYDEEDIPLAILMQQRTQQQ